MEPKKLELHDIHLQLGAKMAPFAGYEMPIKYSSELEEHKTVRSGVGIFDVSHMGEFLIEGDRALELIQRISCNDAAKLVPGQAQYSCLMNDQGGVVDDMLVYCLEKSRYMLVVNAANIKKDWDWINDQNNISAKMTDISDETCLLAVQGPSAKDVLRKLSTIQPDDIRYYNFKNGGIAGINNVIISATGYTGSGGFELFFPRQHAATVWQAVLETGAKYDIKPVGLGARDTLRLEMGYCLYGHELTDTTTPLEAGLGWIVKMEKDFIGKKHLEKQLEKGVDKKLVGFQMIDKGIPRQDYELLNESKESVGIVTSGSQSPSLKFGIGMGYVKPDVSNANTQLYIEIRNKLLAAEVVKLPFYRKA
jgi:aminomethyltransferase